MYRLMKSLANAFAQLGGFVLVALIVMTCTSVLGRSINSLLHNSFFQSTLPDLSNALIEMGVGPVTGDYEIVEAGIAFAIFAFLPLCQLATAHASVDIFTQVLSDRINRLLRAFTECLFAIVMIVIAVQLFAGLQSKFRTGETTLLLEFPVWWGFAASSVAAIVAAVVSVFVASSRVLDALDGRERLAAPQEAEQ